MIKPHGSETLNPLFVYNEKKHQQLMQEAKELPSLLLNSAAAANAVMLGGGYFNPLTGYMNIADGMSIAEKMHTTSGLFWPVPIFNHLIFPFISYDEYYTCYSYGFEGVSCIFL